MGIPYRQRSFQHLLSDTGHRLGVIIPISALLLCFLGQLLLTKYFSRVPILTVSIIAGLLTFVIANEILNKRPTRNWKIFEYILLHAVAFYVFGFILPIPSPYLLFVMLLALIVNFDFGLRPMLVSLIGLFVLISARYIQVTGLTNHTSLSVYFVTYIIIAVTTCYAVFFMRIALRELAAIHTSTLQSLGKEKQIESLINNIGDAVIATDQQLRVAVYNAAALDILDINTDIKNRALSSILQPIDAQNQPVDIKELLNNTTVPTINRDLRVRYADKSIASLFISIAPIYLGYGKSINNGYTLVMRDITREKSLEEERDEFISVVSHELRTPIAISEGNLSNAEFIANKSGDMPAIKSALNEAHNQILFLADMVNDLSTLSRAERSKLEVNVEPIDVKQLLAELKSNYLPEASAKGLALKIVADPSLKTLQSSRLYTKEILQNFITNAIKYTQEGSVTIRAKSSSKGVRFTVKDTGIGISKGDQDQVFDKFFRSEDYRTRKSNGTGLGLYVAMKLTHLIHAEIDIDSELDKGSTFTVFIPDLA